MEDPRSIIKIVKKKIYEPQDGTQKIQETTKDGEKCKNKLTVHEAIDKFKRCNVRSLESLQVSKYDEL